MYHRPPPKGLGGNRKGSSRRWGRCYDNQALFPTFGVSDYETLIVKLAEIGARPHRDDLNKRAFVVWHELPNKLVIKAESFYKEDWRMHSVGAPRPPIAPKHLGQRRSNGPFASPSCDPTSAYAPDRVALRVPMTSPFGNPVT